MFILTVLLIVEAWVLIKLRFKMDKSGLLTLLLHLIVSIIRVIRSSQNFGRESLLIVGGFLVWVSLYYFTFEMLLIRTKLTIDD